MYKKNDPSPKPIKAKVVKASDGSGITSGVTAYHITGTSRTTGSGSLTHIANGLWSYTPTQSETNYNEFAIEFYHADAVARGPIVQVFTSSKLVSELNDLAKTDILSDGVAFPGARIDAAISSRLATGDSRLNYLDASISSRLASTDSRLNNLDAAISSRLATNDSRLNNLDATISSRASATYYTSERAAKLDYLDASISSRLASSAYTAPDNAGIAAIKAKTDKLTFNEGNAVYAYGSTGGASAEEVWTYSNRSLTDKSGFSLTSDYNAAKNAASQSTVDAIKAQTDKLQFTTENYVKAKAEIVGDKTGYGLTTDYDRAKTALAVSEYTAPDNASITAIKTQTDKLQFNAANDVKATLDGETVTVSTNQDKTGYSLTSDYDAAKTAASQSTVNAIKTKTDKLTFNESNAVYAYGPAGGGASAEEVWTYSNRSLTDKSGFSLTSDYNAAKTAASQSTVDAIKSKTDKLTFNESNAVYAYGSTGGASAEEVWTYSNRSLTDKSNFSLTSDYNAAKTAASQSTVDAIKAKTDRLQFTTDNDVKATLDGEKVTVQSNEDKTGYSLTSAYDAAKNAASQSTADAIKAKTDKLTFNDSNAVYAYGAGGASAAEVWSYSTRSLTDKAGFSLTSDYDAAKTAASQSSVNAILNKMAATVVIVSPLNPVSKQITLIKGDSYEAEDNRDIRFMLGPTPDLSSYSLTFTAVETERGAFVIEKTPRRIIQDNHQILSIELTSADTANLPVGPNSLEYNIKAAKSDGDKITLVMGSITVIEGRVR